MSSFRQRKTPGVYVTELNAFPPSIVGVETAVPAFIGYTEKAEINGKPVDRKPIKITSPADYSSVFGGSFKALYNINPVAEPKTSADYDFLIEGATSKSYFTLAQSGESKFNLYNSLRLFYSNGGGTCYIVSTGVYTGPDPKNPKIEGVAVNEADLLEGLNAIEEEVGPTILVVPDAVLLPGDQPAAPATPPAEGSPPAPTGPTTSSAFEKVARAMLTQCKQRKDRVAILDIYDTQDIRQGPNLQREMDQAVENFHGALGTENLNYGMAYFPFLKTSIVQTSEIDYTNYNTKGAKGAGDAAAAATPENGWKPLVDLLTAQAAGLYGKDADTLKKVEALINKIPTLNYDDPTKRTEIVQLNQDLVNALPVLKQMAQIIADKSNVLPPSGAMAGIYTAVDNSRGVWNAPANIALTAVVAPTISISAGTQGNLNVPLNGKAINAIRVFPGRGTLVWGARTLDGNSNDWRYIQVRRTLIYIEQSIKIALDSFVFAPNDGKTWVAVTSMVSNFLQGLWSRGGLMGATATEAFAVECGLGSTMTPMDILEGYMIVQITLQMIHPAEFIELTFKQKMRGGG